MLWHRHRLCLLNLLNEIRAIELCMPLALTQLVHTCLVGDGRAMGEHWARTEPPVPTLSHSLALIPDCQCTACSAVRLIGNTANNWFCIRDNQLIKSGSTRGSRVSLESAIPTELTHCDPGVPLPTHQHGSRTEALKHWRVIFETVWGAILQSMQGKNENVLGNKAR